MTSVPFWKRASESADWLANVAFFEGFEADQLRRVLDLSSEVEVAAGTVIIDQGDAGTDCFVIVDGSASVYMAGQFIAAVSNGTMIGEMALVDHRPRNASVVADTDCKLLRFNAKQFRQLLDEMPKASERVMTLLHERMKREA